jgi:two-component system C4-dicarboxylate transport sensor histidine kinase DctB
MAQVEPPMRVLTIRVDSRDEHVGISVTDNGPGLPDAVRERLFEPFFTTKPAGQGLGLGLAISQAIVEDFHGRLDARNAAGRGACFTVWLERG